MLRPLNGLDGDEVLVEVAPVAVTAGAKDGWRPGRGVRARQPLHDRVDLVLRLLELQLINGLPKTENLAVDVELVERGRLLYVTDGSFGPAGRLGPPTAFESEEGDGHEQEGDDQQGRLERWISCVDAQLKGMGRA